MDADCSWDSREIDEVTWCWHGQCMDGSSCQTLSGYWRQTVLKLMEMLNLRLDWKIVELIWRNAINLSVSNRHCSHHHRKRWWISDDFDFIQSYITLLSLSISRKVTYCWPSTGSRCSGRGIRRPFRCWRPTPIISWSPWAQWRDRRRAPDRETSHQPGYSGCKCLGKMILWDG